MKEQAVIIDGSALMYKSYYALAWNTESSSEEKIIQTINILNKFVSAILNIKNFKYGVVVFDSSKKTFRSELLPSYKAHRPPMPEDLLNASKQIFQVFKNYGFFVLAAPAPYEADDAIGTIAADFNENEIKVDIFTTDKDMLQLVNYYTSVSLMKKGISHLITYDHNTFEKLFDGLQPYQIPLLKGLSGDKSDNYKGLEGIGEKKSLELVSKYKNKKKIYLKIDELKEKIKKTLLDSEKQLDQYIEIATIKTDIVIGHDLNKYLLIKN